MKVKTLKIRIKDKHAPVLRKMAVSVNFAWNYCNELSGRAIREKGLFLSDFDIQKYLTGASKEMGIGITTLQEVSRKYTVSRNLAKQTKLNWRKSFGSRRHLGWVPFKSRATSFKNGQIYHNGRYFNVWDSYGLNGYALRSGSFNEDARGRWYLNVAIEAPELQAVGTGAVGVDLGCKTTATDSNGDSVKGREFRNLEPKLAVAQRANKKDRVKSIHVKIKNRRADALHKYSRKLVSENAAIFVGDVSSGNLVKTKMAKSVLDAGWCSLKKMLEYKCDHAGIIFEEVNEVYTTQTCSSCGSRQDSPKGRAGLRIREWTCECGVTHDRDVNAAKNILALGHERLAGGIAV